MSNQKTVSPKVQVKNFKTFSDLDNLPEDLRISTITVTCKLDTEFYVENIGKYIDLYDDSILSVKYGCEENNSSNRSLYPKKRRKTKKAKKKKKVFYNQVTVTIHSKYKKSTNVKLFKNGSIQMTGCVSGANCEEVLTKLCSELRRVKAVIDPSMSKIKLKPFVSNIHNTDISQISDLKIRMINSNFNVGFKIDREKLYKILLRQDVECAYEPCVHACVNIKYIYQGISRISVFVFESGAIIITGAKERNHIMEAYDFITKKLYENYNEVVKRDLDELLNMPDIKDILNVKSGNSLSSMLDQLMN